MSLKKQLEPLAKELEQVRDALTNIKDGLATDTEEEEEIADALDTVCTHLEDVLAILNDTP